MRALTRVVDQNLVRALLDEDRDRHAPGALARHHPVGAVGDHAGDAVLARRRHPLCAGDFVERDLAQGRAHWSPSPALGGVASSATAKGLSIAMNHCGVLRKITGFFERQLCGYWCFRRPRASSVPASTSALMTALVGVALVPLVVDDALAREARSVVGVKAVGVDGIGDARVDAALVQHAARSPSRCRNPRGHGRARYGRSPCRCRR